ncbi:PilC/PilY family type IV pilus protein [Chromatium okenii]|uniref:PilC/PilY family type IV pilus protein n=1 Tax=Chromatium okenii TaxID=61644 RepID=UPI0026E9E1C3|nr:PilC/PilY family type IV pilus protein [Chromatium okenii]MBV5309218.1 fimbrial assembly protein [Chromatium okenii]
MLDVGYKPNMVDTNGDAVDYFGYFDSHLCYDYSADLFTPVSTTTTKKCPGHWSGDFLNYITTTRIDALRKVLYGGRRFTDIAYNPDSPTTATTVLERSYIPQDAHSWGKEYLSSAHDGYLISDYTPLSQPSAGTRHLFANTTLANEASKKPLMRVLTNSNYRIWNWVAIERPVAGTNCSGGACESTATVNNTRPADHDAFNALIELLANSNNFMGSNAPPTPSTPNFTLNGRIDCSSSCNPYGSDDNYITIFKGSINIVTAGNYEFSINGDDATEVIIDGSVVFGRYTWNVCTAKDDNCKGSVDLTAGSHQIEFRHEEGGGGDKYILYWKGADSSDIWAVVPTAKYSDLVVSTYSRNVPASDMEDYTVRVQVCKDGLLDSNCKPYTNTAPNPDVVTYKPDGLLQEYGKDDKMLFGLISGSFKHSTNMSGGVLRKNIESFMNEINPSLGEVDLSTGVFTGLLGIVKTLDLFRIVDFNSGTGYSYSGGWLTTNPMVSSSSKFPDWGNPIAEMMYESLRYFSGKTTATSVFMPTLTSGKEHITLRDPADSAMDLPAPAWVDPYTANSSLYCSPGAQLVISDVNPSFDTDQVPGTVFGSFSGDISGLNAATEANAIWSAEYGGSSAHFIGEVNGSTDFLGAPTAKTVSGLGNIRGLSPSEPTKQGGYYSAGIARYAFENDLRTDLDDNNEKQDINTFSVALASPLPKIVIPVGTKKVTLVPFAKSVGGYSINITQGQFQPTNTIVDFFIEEFANTDPNGSDKNDSINGGRPSIKFRINYEDVEQGADHDMDAIVLYDLKVNADNTLTVALDSSYAAGSIMQHLGYVISGTTHDGVYLEVRDKDTSVGDDPDYFLDTPAGVSSGGCAIGSPPSDCGISGTDTPLPLTATRTFTASSATDAATVLENPLWYAAKYGSEGNEGLAKGEASPNYFLVTNAGKLQDQLEEAFTRILNLSKATAASAAASSTRTKDDTLIYQAKFDPSDWSGELKAFRLFDNVDSATPEWDSADLMPAWGERNIYTWNGTPDDDSDPAGIVFTWAAINNAQKAYLSNNENVLNWLRGNQSKETKDDGITGFRRRTKILGDIVHSDPLYVGKPQDVGYKHLPTGTAGKDTYDAFLTAHTDRTAVIYVGANDGMLHAFDALTGEEKFAYVPNALFGKLKDLTNLTYKSLTAHRDFVDGSPNVADAYVNDAWHSILIGTLGAGGKAVFALDVTNPDTFTTENVLWEFGDANLGYMVGQITSSPVIGRLQNGQWAAVFGNGYDSGTGAWLYIVNLNDGSLIKKIQVSDDVTNGLSAATLIRDTNQTIAGAYAGDLKGNLWKFDLTGTSSAWGVAYSGVPLFQAVDADDVRQPITGPLEIGTHPLGGYLVYFGTGQYMRGNDVLSRTVQSVYGIWDNAVLEKDPNNSLQFVWDGGSVVTNRSSLLEQEILFELGLPDDPEDYTWRVISQNPMDWEASPIKRGWFLDLISPENGEEGERVVTRPQILSGAGQVLFTSIIPIESDDPCTVGGGKSWVFAIDLFTGGSSTGKTFDINGDGEFNTEDMLIIRDGVVGTIRIIDGVEKIVTTSLGGSETVEDYVAEEGDIKLPASGVQLNQIVDSPRVLRDGTTNDYVSVISGSDGGDLKPLPLIDGGLFDLLTGRLNWQQLR